MGRIYDHLELIGLRLLVRPLPDLNATEGGLEIPEQSRQQQNRAVVEKIGRGAYSADRGEWAEVGLDVGDLVLYQRFAGTWVTLDGVQRLMLHEDEIQGRIRGQFLALVTHAGSESEHLEGEPCLICSAVKNTAAKQWLEAEREALRSQASPAAVASLYSES